MLRQLALGMFFLAQLNYAQHKDSIYESPYFESMIDKLNIKFELDNDIETFEFNLDNSNYSVKPNTNFLMLAGVSHKFLNLKIGYSPKFSAQGNSDEKGSTKVFKLSMDFFIKERWILAFETSNIRGYYVTDLDDFFGFNENDYTVLPTLKTNIFRGITRYKLNDNYSFKAVLNQNEIQRVSAGSFIPSYTYEYFRIADSSLDEELQSVNLILNAGFYYTFVINKKWFANMNISPGIGVGFNKFTVDNDEDQGFDWSSEFIFSSNAHFGLGYNSKSYFGGASITGIATLHDNQSNLEFDSFRGVFNVFIGYRFNPPKWVDKSFDWMEEKNPVKKKQND